MKEPDIKCLVSGSETEGSIAIFEEIVPPQWGPPLHVHRKQIEIFHVLEGSLKFELDGKSFECSAGDAAYIPKGAVHSFKNIGTSPAKIHFELIPALNSEEAFQRLANEEISDLEGFFDAYEMDLAGPPIE